MTEGQSEKDADQSDGLASTYHIKVEVDLCSSSIDDGVNKSSHELEDGNKPTKDELKESDLAANDDVLQSSTVCSYLIKQDKYSSYWCITKTFLLEYTKKMPCVSQ